MQVGDGDLSSFASAGCMHGTASGRHFVIESFWRPGECETWAGWLKLDGTSVLKLVFLHFMATADTPLRIMLREGDAPQRHAVTSAPSSLSDLPPYPQCPMDLTAVRQALNL
jgi:hypothetical protein